MSAFHGNEIVEALNLIGNVHNCNMLNSDVHEHYDCLEDIKKAHEILSTIIEDETR